MIENFFQCALLFVRCNVYSFWMEGGRRDGGEHGMQLISIVWEGGRNMRRIFGQWLLARRTCHAMLLVLITLL